MMPRKNNKRPFYCINALKSISPSEYSVFCMMTSHQLGQHFTECTQMLPTAITAEKTFYITHLLQKNIVGMRVGTSVNGGQRTICGNRLPILTMWVPGTELRLSGLVVSTLTGWASLLALCSTSLIGTVFPHRHAAAIAHF